jgi:hypothetical protein
MPIVKPNDAIHLATAVLEGANMVFNYDKDLLRLNQEKSLKNLTICEPCRPWDAQLSIASIEYTDDSNNSNTEGISDGGAG